MNKTLKKFLLVSAALIPLGGCTAAFLDTAAHGIFFQEDVNLLDKNYAAADYLVQQARYFVKGNAPVVAQPLTDIEQPTMTSDFGKLVPEQVGTRLAQLGYNMNLSPVAAVNTNYVGEGSGQRKSPAFILSGNYKRNRADMDISLKITDARSSKTVAVFDYSLPMTREMADMTQPRPVIMRLEPSYPAAPATPVPDVEAEALTAAPVTPAKPFQ